VDFQLALVEEKEEQDCKAQKAHIINSLMDSVEKTRKAKGLSLYSSPSQIFYNIREGKTTVFAGLKGIDAFKDDSRWLRILSDQGISFVLFENPSSLFNDKGLSEEGEKVLSSLRKNKILPFFKGLDTTQSRAILERSQRPLILFSKELPDEEITDSIKKGKSALGLIMAKEEKAETYFKRLDRAKSALGSDHLIVINEECLWGISGKEQMFELISELLKARYDRLDIIKILSDTFQRVLEETRK
jgi:microsomal dipeptidase-like Zn-dependent dipeptidase